MHNVTEQTVGNTWYTILTDYAGEETLIGKVRRPIFAERYSKRVCRMTNTPLRDKIPMSATVLPVDSRKEDSDMNQQQITAFCCRLSSEDDLDGMSNSIQN